VCHLATYVYRGCIFHQRIGSLKRKTLPSKRWDVVDERLNQCERIDPNQQATTKVTTIVLSVALELDRNSSKTV
jgi:hypothetical protein